jgi:hypothetical protein
MLADAGFVVQVVETDSTGLGQCPHGTTILAREAARLATEDRRRLERELRTILAALPADHGSTLRGPLATRLAQSLAEFRRAYRRMWNRLRGTSVSQTA